MRFTTVVVIAAIVFAAWTIYPVFRLQYEHQREVDSLKTELDTIKTRNDELRQQVDELKTPEGVEQIARETLGLAKPGEQVYVVTGDVTSETSATALPAEGAEGPLWQRALDALFGLN